MTGQLSLLQVRGRFARNDDAGAVQPHESRKALLAAKKSRAAKWSPSMVKAAGVALVLWHQGFRLNPGSLERGWNL